MDDEIAFTHQATQVEMTPIPSYTQLTPHASFHSSLKTRQGKPCHACVAATHRNPFMGLDLNP